MRNRKLSCILEVWKQKTANNVDIRIIKMKVLKKHR